MDQRPRNRDDQPVGLVAPPAPAGPYAYPAAGAGASHVAGLGGPGPETMYTPRPGGGSDPAAVSALNFLAGVWLVLAPFALDYENMGPGFDGRWNDIAIGIAIAVVALVRILAPYRSVGIAAINVGLGGWLVVAPFVLAYSARSDATAATWNDVIVGAIVLVVAMVSAALGIRGPRDGRETDRT